MRNQTPERSFTGGRANCSCRFPQSHDALYSPESLQFEVASLVPERQPIGQIPIRASTMNQDGIHVWFHRPATEVHQGEEDLRAFVIPALRRPPARIPEGLLMLCFARGSVAKTVKRFEL